MLVPELSYEHEDPADQERRGDRSPEQPGAGVEMAPLDDAVDPERSQRVAQVDQGDDEGKEAVFCGRQHSGKDQIRAGESQPRRPVHHDATEGGRSPEFFYPGRKGLSRH